MLLTALDFVPGFIVSNNNKAYLQKLLEVLFRHFSESPDFSMKKGCAQALKEITIELNGIRDKTNHLARKAQAPFFYCMPEGDPQKPLFNAFQEQFAIKAIMDPFELNLEAHEEREYLK